MWDFSGDESLFFVASIGAAGVGAVRWYRPLVTARRSFAWSRGLIALACLPILGLVPIFIVLQTLADPVFVVGHLDYTLLFLVGGLAWLFWGAWMFQLVGVETPGELLERKNRASLLTIAGAMLGVAFAYAWSNAGNGPTIWTTLVPAFTATVALPILAGLLEFMSDTADAIAIDRDVSAGIRTATLFAANGAILGRAMAGDFHGWEDTFKTFAVLCWPAVALTVVAAIVARVAQPTPERPKPDMMAWGIVPAAIFAAVTVGYLVELGLPEIARTGVAP